MKNKIMMLMAALCMCAIPMTASAQERDEVGVGIELGTNYIMSVDGDAASSISVGIDFALTDTLSAGLYREQLDPDDPTVSPLGANVSLTSLQVRQRAHEMLDFGVRFGNVDDTADVVNGTGQVSPYGGIFAAVTPFASQGETFSGAIRINLGYDFLTDNAMDDLVRVGISAAISF